METIDIVVISLLVIGLVLAIICCILFVNVKGKTGPQGSAGRTGPSGTSLTPVSGELRQVNIISLPNTTGSATQFTRTITVEASGQIAPGNQNSTVVVGFLPLNVSPPEQTVYAIGFSNNTLYTQSNPITISIQTTGEIRMIVSTAGTIYNFNATYNVSV